MKSIRFLLRDDLDEVAAGVVEHGDPHFADIGCGRGEGDAGLGQPLVFGFDVVDGELGQPANLGSRLGLLGGRGPTGYGDQREAAVGADFPISETLMSGKTRVQHRCGHH